MPRERLSFLAFVVFILLTSGANAQGMSAETKAWCERTVPALRETLRTPPKEQAERSAATRDLRYLEWFGIASAIPGVKSQACVREALISRPFEGTSDALCSEEHRKLYEQSYSYAEAFNRHMAVEREKLGLKSCNDA
jgi:hypothetical protein